MSDPRALDDAAVVGDPPALESLRHENLFATPLLRYRIADHAALNAALIEEGARLRALSDGLAKSNRGGWHSEGNLFDDCAAPIRTLHAAAIAAVWDATARIKSKADPASLRLRITGWMNANPPGGFNAPHTHPGAHWSGVYYVSQPEIETGNSGMIEFLDPRSDLPNWRILRAAALRPKKKLRPAPGEMILFPSFLMHWVYPNEADDDRISIAFNATFGTRKDT